MAWIGMDDQVTSWHGIECLGRYLAGRQLSNNDTHKTSTTTSFTWLHLVFRRGGQDRVEINGLPVPPASSPSIERRLTVVYPQRPKNLRVAGKTGKRLDALTALPSGGRGRRDWVPFRTRVPSRMLSVPSPRNLVASKLPGSVAEVCPICSRRTLDGRASHIGCGMDGGHVGACGVENSDQIPPHHFSPPIFGPRHGVPKIPV